MKNLLSPKILVTLHPWKLNVSFLSLPSLFPKTREPLRQPLLHLMDGNMNLSCKPDELSCKPDNNKKKNRKRRKLRVGRAPVVSRMSMM